MNYHMSILKKIIILKKIETDDFEFNQDIDFENETRSPGWLRYQKKIKK